MKKILLSVLIVLSLVLVAACNQPINDDPSKDLFQLTINTEGLGKVNGAQSGKYEKGSEFIVAVTYEKTEQFDGWFINSELVQTKETFAFTLDSDLTLLVKFSTKLPVANTTTAVFGHNFISGDFKQAGGTSTINGLTWNYTSMTMLGANAAYGIQIGSNANPQKDGVTFKTSIPENITITGYSITFCNGSGGSADATFTFGSYSKTDNTNIKNDPQEFSYDELDLKGNELIIKLQKIGNGAIYWHSLVINFNVPVGVSFDVKVDVIEPVDLTPGNGLIPAINYSTIAVEDYYDLLSSTSENETLRTELRGMNQIKTHPRYSDAKYMLLYTDESVDEPGFNYGLWDGDKIVPKWDSGSSWNREHVWACAQMKKPGATNYRPTESTKDHTSDLHNLRVACPNSNGLHGNKYFDEVTMGGAFYPNPSSSDLAGNHDFRGDHRGDVARILFYMYVQYSWLQLNDTPWLDDVTMGKLSLLLQWHVADPVDAFEIQRNDRVYGYQGNRNPFIDLPDLADRLF